MPVSNLKYDTLQYSRDIPDVVGDIPETVFVEDAVCHPHDVLVLDGTVALRADLDHVGHRDT